MNTKKRIGRKQIPEKTKEMIDAIFTFFQSFIPTTSRIKPMKPIIKAKPNANIAPIFSP